MDYMFDSLSTEEMVIALLVFLLVVMLFGLLRIRYVLARKGKALDKSEHHIQMMGDNLPDEILFQLVCSKGNHFSFNYITKGYEQVLGIDRKQVLQDARMAFEHLYESDIPLLKTAHQQAEADLIPADLEIRILDVMGNLKWLRIRAVPLRENGNLIWDGFVQDITQQKQIEATLLEEKHNFQNLFETIDEFLFVYDMDGKLLHTNPAVERRLNYSAEELESMSFFELYPENLRPEVFQMLARMQSEPTVHSNLPLQIKDEGTIAVEMNLFQGNWKNRKAIFGVARDISSRQQAETALRESQQMLQLIMDTIPMSVFWKDKDSLYLGGNHTFIKDCGLTQEEEVLGKSAYDFFDSNTAKHMIERDQQVINSDQALLNEQHTFSCPEGSICWRETSKIPLHDEKGAVTGILEISRDVTEQNRAEEHLKRTLEDLERFNQLMRGRERRTLELKAEINTLLQEMGKDIKYKTTTKPLL